MLGGGGLVSRYFMAGIEKYGGKVPDGVLHEAVG